MIGRSLIRQVLIGYNIKDLKILIDEELKGYNQDNIPHDILRELKDAIKQREDLSLDRKKLEENYIREIGRNDVIDLPPALHLAVRELDFPLVKKLVEEVKVDPNVCNARNMTAFEYLIKAIELTDSNKVDYLNIFNFLHMYTSSPDEKYLQTPLHLAAVFNNYSLAKVLVAEYKFNFNAKDIWGNTPADCAFGFVKSLYAEHIKPAAAIPQPRLIRRLAVREIQIVEQPPPTSSGFLSRVSVRDEYKRPLSHGKIIGEGSFGVVYNLIEGSTGSNNYVIKYLKQAYQFPTRLSFFPGIPSKEAEMQMKVSRMKTYRSLAKAGAGVIVMRKEDGVKLSTFLVTLDVKSQVRLFLTLLLIQQLQQFHEELKLVHGDLSISNILFQAGNDLHPARFNIIDFSLTTELGKFTQRTSLRKLDCAGYESIAPECVPGPTVAHPAMDVYALAPILYCFLPNPELHELYKRMRSPTPEQRPSLNYISMFIANKMFSKTTRPCLLPPEDKTKDINSIDIDFTKVNYHSRYIEYKKEKKRCPWLFKDQSCTPGYSGSERGGSVRIQDQGGYPRSEESSLQNSWD